MQSEGPLGAVPAFNFSGWHHCWPCWHSWNFVQTLNSIYWWISRKGSKCDVSAQKWAQVLQLQAAVQTSIEDQSSRLWSTLQQLQRLLHYFKVFKLTWYHFIRTYDRNSAKKSTKQPLLSKYSKTKATFSSTSVTLWCYFALFSDRLWHDLFEVIKDTLITTNGMLKLETVDEELFTWHNVSKILLQLQRQNQEIKGTINILHKETLSVLAQRNHCILEKLKPAFNSGA